MSGEIFRLTELHLRLAREMNVRWNGDDRWGAPWIDEKRPYGNSDILADLRAMLEDPDPWTDEALWVLHRQMDTALQIILRCGPEAGLYEAPQYTRNWSPRTSSEEDK